MKLYVPLNIKIKIYQIIKDLIILFIKFKFSNLNFNLDLNLNSPIRICIIPNILFS